MKTSIATVSISGELTEKLDAIAAAGFDGIEIFEQDFIAHDGSPRDVGRQVRDNGLEILLFQPFRDFECLPEPDRSRAFDRAERKFDVMGELETDLMLICSSVHPQALGGIDRAASDLFELGERAAKRGIKIGYEALAWGTFINDHRDAWEIVRRADHHNIGLIVDSFHTLGRKLSPETIRAIPGDKIFFVQLADAPLIEMDLLYWSRHFRNMPGEGDLDVAAFMRAVAATGYDGPVSLEIFNDQFRGGSAQTIARDGYCSLMALADKVENKEPNTALDIPTIPKPAHLGGFEYIEFAADESDVNSLGHVLQTMGFDAVGSHINKALSVWQQGDIRFVLNTDPDGFARRSYLQNGISVCDIGYRVDNAQAAIERAEHLGRQRFTQPLGPGELDIPAMRGISGGVLHFIDKKSGLDEVWSKEFSALKPASSGAGLTHVDHIAQSVNYDEMLSWSLFYTSLFALQKTPVVDVVDPGGIVRSQVISSANGSVRITLNGADTARTLAGQFVADRKGSAIQHIALTSEDIFETRRLFDQRGFRLLEIGANYYDDVAARFGLDAGFVADLKNANILYDEDGDGRFFQFYSAPLENGFFFEIVQRVDGYEGFGAPNAPYRIAALRRAISKRTLRTNDEI